MFASKLERVLSHFLGVDLCSVGGVRGYEGIGMREVPRIRIYL